MGTKTMQVRFMSPSAIVVVALLWTGVAVAADLNVNFDDGQAGATPQGWRIAATNGGDRPARWAVEQGKGPKGDSKVFSLVEPEGTGPLARLTSSNVYNIAWLPDARVRDVDASVAVRANTGSIDQGGGLIWRAKDADNYYIARYNPLERNFRIYFVKD